ncbi:19336_t:CDS:2 [Cetraspora pellucida]|uniref:19336_t:CDS:1 n=1 Tax=Cetraspora pellucida TaxID=1433469 RepID=A0A9N8WIA1_9GLOM|nr:19336_t:CDS:2 [Cetraspora pellucida]
MAQTQYINWIEKKWRIKVDESTISHILKISEQRLSLKSHNSDIKWHKLVSYPQFKLCYTKILLTNINAELRNFSSNIQQENPMSDDLEDTIQDLNLSCSMTVEEFLNISEKNVVYEVSKDDQIINKLVYLFKNTKGTIDLNETYNSHKISVISVSTAISSLKTIYTFLL